MSTPRFHIFEPNTATASSAVVALAWAVGRLDADAVDAAVTAGERPQGPLQWVHRWVPDMECPRQSGTLFELLFQRFDELWQDQPGAHSPKLAEFQRIVDLLLHAGAKPHPSPADGSTPLHHLFQRLRGIPADAADPFPVLPQVIRRLVEAGLSPDTPNQQGITPLVATLTQAHVTQALWLVEAGASVVPPPGAHLWPFQALLHSAHVTEWDGEAVLSALTFLLPAMERAVQHDPHLQADLSLVMALERAEVERRVRHGDWDVWSGYMNMEDDEPEAFSATEQHWEAVLTLMTACTERLALSVTLPASPRRRL